MDVSDEMYDTLKQPTYRAGIAMSSAHRQLRKLKQTILEPHGLSMAQWSILGIIHDANEQGITLSEVANQLSATQAFVSSNIKSLEDKQLINRETDANDQRVSKVYLQKNVSKTVEEIEAAIRQQLRKSIYSKVSREQLAVFLYLMSIFAESD